jgi:hypothetical protein
VEPDEAEVTAAVASAPMGQGEEEFVEEVEEPPVRVMPPVSFISK